MESREPEWLLHLVMFFWPDAMILQACQLKAPEDRIQRSGGIERIQRMHGLQHVIQRVWNRWAIFLSSDCTSFAQLVKGVWARNRKEQPHQQWLLIVIFLVASLSEYTLDRLGLNHLAGTCASSSNSLKGLSESSVVV